MTILYAITDSQLLPGTRLFTGVESVLRAGCPWIQYRDKSDDQDKRLFEATELLHLCRAYNAKLIINDDVALTKAIQADGVHLGQTDGSISDARTLLGNDAIIGATCHDSVELAVQAVNAGASYVAFGRFFPSKTKPHARPADLQLLLAARSQLNNTPLAVIGGITLDKVHQTLAAGAHIVAICDAIFSADNIEKQAQLFMQQLSATS